jgi:hypothetical protein
MTCSVRVVLGRLAQLASDAGGAGVCWGLLVEETNGDVLHALLLAAEADVEVVRVALGQAVAEPRPHP